MTPSPSTSPATPVELGRIGIWAGEFRYGEGAARAEAAAELDELGYGALWMPGAAGGDLFGDMDVALAATRRMAVATGIINVWRHEPAEVGAWWRGLPGDRRDRLMLGIGISHARLIGADYGKPLATMSKYLDGLDSAGVPADHRCVAALGPKMLDLARDRSAGSHPYLVPPEHTAIARERLGPSALLAPEQGVILETDPAKAREIGRQAIEIYLALPNYSNNWRRLGFTEEDVTTPSDRLLDALFAWGGTQQIAARVQAHLDAGADHVCLQVLTGPAAARGHLPREAWRELAAALL
jgi:probable F420-dependent oxidoreductase